MVAVKTFHSLPTNDINALARILREVYLNSKLYHENIVPMLGIWTEFSETISIVSHWMESGDAHTYVQKVENDPRHLLKDIASGLHYLHVHELGPICHGDLKGGNVLISRGGRALLTDFGYSTLMRSSFSLDVLVVGGSFPWMAPELLNNYVPSIAGDVWAFGMTLLELFTRSVPFHDCKHVANVMVRILQHRLPDRPTEVSTNFRMSDAWWDL
ncbi:hypothetical protein ID866_10386 [Astraeus odoratus]|nr:hypothetical protein ID866_10386 [Astraeus odoratus]